MKFHLSVTLFAGALLSGQNCAEKPSPSISTENVTPAIQLPAGFNTYWYAGQAEICTYDVEQERYGEMRQAEQVNVFVTEDFSRSKQVKLDYPSSAATDRLPVLKLNAIRRFHTGIYDYSLMQSVFTPVSGEPTLKATTSVQDWCGHVFMQTNLGNETYRLQGYSYFEQEGDQDLTLPRVMLEDELWTRLRLNPDALPSGKIKLQPSALYVRLRHQSPSVQMADIQLEKGNLESTLRVVYTDIARSLTIRFETNFPHKILGWEENIQGKMVSSGTLKSTRKSAYWAEHDNAHAPLRDSLKLRF
ncbi:MAG: hypothetical protein SFV22_01265 [Saprospiraceae bacterium]|nr:hypothetical protein [Saprospiraceae bacterium]